MSATEHITDEKGAATRTTLPLFHLGRLFATPSALAALCEAGESADPYIRRHQRGDWGEELCEEDRQENDLSVASGFRVLSAYRTRAGVKFWIITEADRSSTTLLLPEEY